MNGRARDLDPSFLAHPDRLADWRLVLAYEAATSAGVLDALPGRIGDLAASCDLDPAALRPVVSQLVVWRILEVDEEDVLRPGPLAPPPLEHEMLAHHGRLIRRWASLLGPRLRDRAATDERLPRRLVEPEIGMAMLEAVAAPRTTEIVDACLERGPGAHRVLDLAGGHGAHALGFAARGCDVVLQDLPEVIELAASRNPLRERGVRLVPADLHERLAEGPFDLVLCSLTTNMFAPSTNRDLLRRVHATLAPTGVLAIVTYLRGYDPVAAGFGLQMLVSTDAGDAYADEDYRAWLTEAGFGTPELSEIGDPPQSLLLAPAGRLETRA